MRCTLLGENKPLLGHNQTISASEFIPSLISISLYASVSVVNAWARRDSPGVAHHFSWAPVQELFSRSAPTGCGQSVPL